MILADHCVWQTTITHLQTAGYAVTPLRDVSPTDAKDPAVLHTATQADLILLTIDRDFGNVLTYPPSQYQGIIVLRITPATEERVHARLLELLTEKTREQLRHVLAVVTPGKYRLRLEP